jgi:putative hydroxymethylpyrimidine transport system substrate-binding protein
VERDARARRGNHYDPRSLMPMRPELRRRGALLAASLIGTALCAGCGEVRARTQLGPARPLTVAIDSQPSALYAALYGASSHGDFAAGALAVTIEQPKAGDPLAALESGTVGVAIVSEPVLLAARDSGASVVAIGALIRQPLDGIVSLASRAVASPRQLAGRTIALSPAPLAAAELDTAVSTVAPRPARVRRVTLGGDLTAALSASRNRAAATIGGNWAVQSVELALTHRRAHVLQIQQAGVPTYSQLVIVVRVGEAHRDGPLLRAFLQSLTRGQRAAAADPAGIAATLAKVNPRLSVRFERSLLAVTVPLAAPLATQDPYGFQDPYAWQAFGSWMHAHGLLRNGTNSGLAITNEFLPGRGA